MTNEQPHAHVGLMSASWCVRHVCSYAPRALPAADHALTTLHAGSLSRHVDATSCAHKYTGHLAPPHRGDSRADNIYTQEPGSLT